MVAASAFPYDGLGVGLLALAGLATTVYGLAVVRTARRVETSAGVSQEPTAGGPVHLEGTAGVHEGVATAPVSGADCLGFEFSIEERDDAFDEDGNTWNKTRGREHLETFLLETDRGTVLVDGAAAEPRFEDDERSDQPAADQGFLGRPKRRTETLLRPGETAFVAGVSHPAEEASHPLPDEAVAFVTDPDADDDGGLLARLTGNRPQPFYVVDRSREEYAGSEYRRGLLLVVLGVAAVVGPSAAVLTL